MPMGDTASGVYNTSRQIGGALAVFGALLAQPATFIQGMRTSLLIAAGVALMTAVASLLLRTSGATRRHEHNAGTLSARVQVKGDDE